MKMSKKCQYALQALFELANRNAGRPIKIRDIADAQRISPRFLEVILNELKHGGFVESRRGNEGGYILAKDPKELTVGEIIKYIQGPISVAPDKGRNDKGDDVYCGSEAFEQLWQEVNSSISEVCDSKTFAELVAFEEAKRRQRVADYII